MAIKATVKGKCMICGKDITPGAIGYCPPCAEKVYKELDEKYPWEVIDGGGHHIESFETEKEANDFVYNMRYCEVQKKN